MADRKTVHSVKVTSLESADQQVSALAARKDDWVQVSIPMRIDYLRRCIDGMQSVADQWVELVCYHKGIDPSETLAGEEWMSGIMIVQRYLRLMINALEAGGHPKPKQWLTRPDGQVVAQVFPEKLMDKLLWRGFTAEVWIEPYKPSTQGSIYREPQATGKVCLLLGSGNNSAVCPSDIVYKLFVENQVVILKMHPVNDYEGPFIEQAFQSLIKDGFLRLVYGDAEFSNYLCHHHEIDTVHLIGSKHTHDVIVWGKTPEEQAERKIVKEPLLKKQITSELGCVTPVIIVPGSWSRADLAFQARHVASMVVHNASYNCDAAKVVVMAKGWNQREAFLEELHQALAEIPSRKAYYPGSQKRYQTFLEHYPQAYSLVRGGEEIVPWTVIPDVPPESGEYALTHEAFCGVLAEVTLDAYTTEDFLGKVVPFVNHKIEGTLSCILLVNSATERAYKDKLEEVIAELHYGNVAVNTWSAISSALGSTTWGAFPGNSIENIGSGRGVIHNAYLFDHPQKSVLRAPFRIKPTPGWFATHKNLLRLGKCMSAFEAYPSWSKIPRIVIAALKG